jgi:hypothetical protein
MYVKYLLWFLALRGARQGDRMSLGKNAQNVAQRILLSKWTRTYIIFLWQNVDQTLDYVLM